MKLGLTVGLIAWATPIAWADCLALLLLALVLGLLLVFYSETAAATAGAADRATVAIADLGCRP